MSGVFGLNPTFQSPGQSPAGGSAFGSNPIFDPVISGRARQSGPTRGAIEKGFGVAPLPEDANLGPAAGRDPFGNPFSQFFTGSKLASNPNAIFEGIQNQGLATSSDILNQIQGLNQGQLLQASQNLPDIGSIFGQSFENLSRARGTPNFLGRGAGFLEQGQGDRSRFDVTEDVLTQAFDSLIKRLNEQFLL
jgi:hypothetical protein